MDKFITIKFEQFLESNFRYSREVDVFYKLYENTELPSDEQIFKLKCKDKNLQVYITQLIHEPHDIYLNGFVTDELARNIFCCWRYDDGTCCQISNAIGTDMVSQDYDLVVEVFNQEHYQICQTNSEIVDDISELKKNIAICISPFAKRFAITQNLSDLEINK